MRIINPSNHEIIQEISEDNNEMIQKKYNRASAALAFWKESELDERINRIKRFYSLLEDHKEEFTEALNLEVGKPIHEASNEVNGARNRILYFVEHAKRWLRTEEVNQNGKTREFLAFDPLGVVCNISAWNYPLLIGVNVFIPALISGNTVLYKPSEYSTLTGLLIEKYLHEAGIPEDVFISVIGGASAGEKLLDLPCHGYFFTGSYKTGKYIAERVAEKLVPIGLELGGKDPVYVTDKVDIDHAASAVAEGAFYNNGQSCCAIERVYVHEDIYAPFIEKFVAEVRKLDLGPVTRQPHIAHLDHQVADAIGHGARILEGGKRKEKGNFYEPTVLINVHHEMSVMKDETFGPIIGVMKVSDDDEAIRLMNDTEYGLTASVYSEDLDRAKRILRQIDTGTAYINCCDRVSPYLPWTGRKNSGLGSTLSYLGILAFNRPRAWHINEHK